MVRKGGEINDIELFKNNIGMKGSELEDIIVGRIEKEIKEIKQQHNVENLYDINETVAIENYCLVSSTNFKKEGEGYSEIISFMETKISKKIKKLIYFHIYRTKSKNIFVNNFPEKEKGVYKGALDDIMEIALTIENELYKEHIKNKRR